MGDTVDFNKKSVKEYLDKCIECWRDYRDKQASDSKSYEKARHYIDAFQSVRVSIFGEIKG